MEECEVYQNQGDDENDCNYFCGNNRFFLFQWITAMDAGLRFAANFFPTFRACNASQITYLLSYV